MLGRILVLLLVCAAAAAQPQDVGVGWSSTESSGAGMSGGGSTVQSSVGEPLTGSQGGGGAGVQGGFMANPNAQGPVTSVSGSMEIPLAFSLEQNYPNPFNPATTILFTLPRASSTSLIVYNLLGQEVARPVDEWREAGSHTVRLEAAGWSSGVYFYRLKADGLGAVRSMVIVR